MAVIATPRKFAMQQAFEILLRKPLDKSIIAYLTDLKTSGLENTVEMVYPTGGAGNVYIGTGFQHSKRATMTVSTATFNIDVLATQNGTEVVRASTEITYYDVIDPDASGKYFTKFTAIGATGSEIGWVYTVRADGTYEKTYTQAATATVAGQFEYSSATKEITFFAGDEPAAGEKIACAYTWATADNASQITVTAEGLPPTVLVSAYGIARDVCTGETFRCVIEGQAQVDGNWAFDLSADGDPVIQNLSMEFVKGCLNNDMYKFTIYTEDELASTPQQVATPLATPAGGTYSTPQTVTVTCATVGASMFYTIDGTTPTTSSTPYTTAINIPASATTDLKVIATMAGMNDSNILTEQYIIS